MSQYPEKVRVRLWAGVMMGILLGVIFGKLMESLAYGIIIGLVAGVILGSRWAKAELRKENSVNSGDEGIPPKK